MDLKIPAPVTFNPHKHHFGFLTDQIKTWRRQDWEKIQPELFFMGENLIDLYLGSLSVNQVCYECIRYFRNENVLERTAFLDWLYPREYRKIELADSSVWVVKKGIDPERFIHIHPAKYSPLTIRVRAATLKTVVALTTHSVSIQKEITENLDAVNTTRRLFLQLSPVKSLNPEKGIIQLWKRFSNQLNEAPPLT
jgi:hypothetical protein